MDQGGVRTGLVDKEVVQDSRPAGCWGLLRPGRFFAVRRVASTIVVWQTESLKSTCVDWLGCCLSCSTKELVTQNEYCADICIARGEGNIYTARTVDASVCW